MNPKLCIQFGLAAGLFVLSPAMLLAGEDEMTKEVARKVVSALDANKTSLTAAIKAAEDSSKGTAVYAEPEMKGEDLTFEIYCVASDKLMQVNVGKSGQVTGSKEIKHDKEAKKEADEEDVPTPGRARKMVKALEADKASLASGIAAAEEATKGRAVLAHGEMEHGKLLIAVFCLVGDKLMDIDIDAKTGKPAEPAKEVGKSEEEKPKK